MGVSLPHEDGFSKVKMVTLRAIITVFVITMVLMQMKDGCIGIGFIQRIMVFLVMKSRLQKGFHQTILRNG